MQNIFKKILNYKEPFLLAYISKKIVLRISFLSLKNANIRFAETKRLT